MRVRAFTDTGKMPEIVQAVERDGCTIFIDTLGKRWASTEIISFRTIVDTKGNPL